MMARRSGRAPSLRRRPPLPGVHAPFLLFFPGVTGDTPSPAAAAPLLPPLFRFRLKVSCFWSRFSFFAFGVAGFVFIYLLLLFFVVFRFLLLRVSFSVFRLCCGFRYQCFGFGPRVGGRGAPLRAFGSLRLFAFLASFRNPFLPRALGLRGDHLPALPPRSCLVSLPAGRVVVAMPLPPRVRPAVSLSRLQGYLAYKKPPPSMPRDLWWP